MLSSVAALTSSFTAPAGIVSSARSAVSPRMGVSDMEGVGVETGGKVFDPMGFSKIASAETLAWYRAAELKHSRIAMVRATMHVPTAPSK
eukprot:scaffold12204_cov61-Phaeocystis_antarctica.AAC.3